MTLRAKLQYEIEDVRLSGRLTSSPACLAGDEIDLSLHITELLLQGGVMRAGRHACGALPPFIGITIASSSWWRRPATLG